VVYPNSGVHLSGVHLVTPSNSHQQSKVVHCELSIHHNLKNRNGMQNNDLCVYLFIPLWYALQYLKYGEKATVNSAYISIFHAVIKMGANILVFVLLFSFLFSVLYCT
jgi:hypothetical protein